MAESKKRVEKSSEVKKKVATKKTSSSAGYKKAKKAIHNLKKYRP